MTCGTGFLLSLKRLQGHERVWIKTRRANRPGTFRKRFWAAMRLQRLALLAFLLVFIVIGTTGCVMHRTVKDGSEVVAQGYVVKAPLIAP